MRRMTFVALRVLLGLSLAGAPGLAAFAQSQDQSQAQSQDQSQDQSSGPVQGHPVGQMPAPASGPMTWGGVLSRSLLPTPSSNDAAAELVEGAAMPAGDTPEDGVLLAQGTVVELFTSQGCAACPSADAYFGDLAGRDDVIALALHVDYWDYIGWADAFARPDHAKRQKAYAKAAGSRVIYTPQIVVGGKQPMSGNDRDRVGALMSEEEGEPLAMTLRLRDGDATPVLSATPQRATGEMAIQLVRFRPRDVVTILRGENAGRTITYRNIVTSWEQIGHWNGQSKLRMDVRIDGDEPAVILFQRAGFGAILAAARLR